MSTLNSASTLDEIRASYADNASYAEDQDVMKARAFLTACRLLLLHLPKRASHAGRAEEVELDLSVIQGEMKAAKAWLAAFSAGIAAARAVYTDFSGFRE